jgi:hypothetical protein
MTKLHLIIAVLIIITIIIIAVVYKYGPFGKKSNFLQDQPRDDPQGDWSLEDQLKNIELKQQALLTKQPV